MEIKINGHDVDIQLQDENRISQIVSYISEWSAQRDLIVVRAEVDGKPFQPESVPDMDISSVREVNFVIESRADVAFSAVEEGMRYCARAGRFSVSMEHAAPEDIQNLMDGIDWLCGVINSAVNILHVDRENFQFKGLTADDYTEQLVKSREALAETGKLPGGENVFLAVKDFLRALFTGDEMKRMILHSVDSPEVIISGLLSLKEKLPEEVRNLEEISAAFQTGHDKEGSEKLQRFVDFIFGYTRACWQVAPVFGILPDEIIIDGVSLMEKNRIIQDYLNETIEVMENQDYISLSDVLEYEMKPAIEELGSYIDILVKKTGTSE